VKIADIRAEKVNFKLARPVVVSRGVITAAESVVTKVITDEGICGYGEGTGATFITGETTDTILGAIQLLKEELIGVDPLAIGHIHRVMDRVLLGNGSAKAAIDIALYDIMGKVAGAPLYKILGGVSAKVETDMTVLIDKPSVMAQRAKEIVAQGFRFLKVKTGADPDRDIETIRLIREAVGPDIHIKIDANQAWSVSECLRIMEELRKFDVTVVEQPTQYWDTDGLAQLRRRGSFVVMADESCFTHQDAIALIKKDAVDMINIKLMKCGGLYRAMQIDSICEASGIGCMVGCMVEGRIAIAAGAALVASHPNIRFADLDSSLSLEHPDWIKGGFTVRGGEITLSEKPGLGFEIDM
jgi:L-alanine-DL-glutamate epimerase-like enolase superfamily enzyme